MNIGFESQNFELTDLTMTANGQTVTQELDGVDLELKALVMDNTFGYGIIRDDSMRVWIGPQLRVLYASGEVSTDDNDDTLGDASGFGVGAGLALGGNFKMDSITPFVTAGYRYTKSYLVVDIGDSGDETDFDLTDGSAFLNAGVLF